MISESLRLLLALALLWAFWFYCWRRYALDAFRQDLFSIRDAMFDMAAQRKDGMNFNQVAYGCLRHQINGLIRFAHRFSSLSVISFKLFSLVPIRHNPYWRRDFVPPSERAIQQIKDDNLRLAFRRVRVHVILAAAKYLLRTSPLFLITASIFL